MRRYFIQLAYKGTLYHGWQVQKNTVRTVQQVMQEKLSLLLHEKIELYGCGRTDTGVHAQDFYASFDSEKDDLHDEKYHWLYKMNRCLPDDISVYAIIPVTAEANARFSAVARTYKYYIHQVPNPFLVDTSWHLYGDLDLDLMNRAAQKIRETKDFGSFVKSNNNHNNYICRIHEAVWAKEGNNLIFTVRANRFLRNMVRALVGTMVDIGSGKTKLEDLDEIINSSNRSQAGTSVPARGLHLVKIEYKKEIFQ
ncbi:MAG: tRNA pseudouridine(38-40) synthase TruA [Bacteroidia bacterium]